MASLQDQAELIRTKRSLKLNGLVTQDTLLEVIDMILDTVTKEEVEIERLSLQSNGLSHLPKKFLSIASNIRYLDLHDNNFTLFPAVISECRHLEILDLSSNHLTNIPRGELIKLQNLKVISLKENKFRYLPPVLGDLPHLNLIEVADNPLQMPSLEVIKGFQNQSADLDWVNELKQYLRQKSSHLEIKLLEAEQRADKLFDKPSPAPPSVPPPIVRSRSVSETRSKASKAARRMGLIIKKTDDGSKLEEVSANTTVEDDASSALSLFFSNGEVLKIGLDDPAFSIASPPLTTTASTVPNSLSSSPSLVPQVASSIPPPLTVTSATSSASNSATATVKAPRNRSRSNTLKEIDNLLQKNDTDTEHKSGAYFRRLSTLQEVPPDDLPLRAPHSANTSRQGSLTVETDARQVKSPSILSRTVANGDSPSKVATRRSVHSAPVIIKASRKILFSFSELHSSVRRFTGFCTDKKLTMKMVSLLYATKANIDSLVESLEVMEESGDNIDNIVNTLYASLASFKQIMTLLSENLATFSAKIDVCFLRMLLLTFYGSFHELLNAYRMLSPTPKLMTNVSSTALHTLDPKAKSVNPGDTEDIDEKLCQTIELATEKAQVVFSELTKAISKSAIASTNNPQQINPQVAAKVKELTTICMSSMDITKRLKTKLITIRNNPSHTTKKLFWDDTNLFLKAIVSTLGPVKLIMKDLPILNEARASILDLTKTTKDIPLLLEVSSFAGASDGNTAVPLNTSLTNMFTPLSAHPSHSLSLANLSGMAQPMRTPLAATLGPAALAIVPNVAHDHPVSPGVSTTGLATAPAQLVGQYYARNGMNPFDGLIMENRRDEGTT